MMDATKLPVVEILSLIDDGKLSSEELVKAYRAALEGDRASAKPLNAYVEFFDDAGDLARAADARRKAGERLPLLGVPFAVKDNISIAGRALTCASDILEGYTSPYSATVIERLVAAGAIPVGRTNMDEFAMGSSCEYSRYGATRNPFDRDRTPGGSSGGSAVAVAAGMAAFSLGSETGGSVRLPASFCGLYGLKPSYGRLSRYGLVAFGSSLDQIGICARTAGDAALILSVAAGRDDHDETSADAPVPGARLEALPRGLAGLRVAVPGEFSGIGTDPEVASAFERVISLFEKAGAAVERISFPLLKSCIALYYIIAPAEASSNLARFDGIRYGARVDGGKGLFSLYSVTRDRGFGPEVKRRIVVGNFVLSSGYVDAYYKKALAVRTLLVRELTGLFGRFDLLLSPTSPTPAFRIGEKVDDPVAMYLSDLCTTFANLAGVPALSIPAGATKSGLPIGVQIAGKLFSEPLLLGTAAALRGEGL
ncbi:MAG: Asp-tRNA(Asn)/Glu-tRNA(Gln) amidotransferase subunit GatA [Spirochaetes bacterium]|nr:Asp-tRNA(Asn)/Glu-tRNA(Gln) amidotransferase subunit GatA [Spirochaetota bacterium]